METPITGGSIQLQSEGAEIFFKDILIRPLSRPPQKFETYLPAPAASRSAGRGAPPE